MPAPTVEGAIGIGPIAIPLPDIPIPGGKRKRSSCRLVSAADLEGFYRGSVAPWVVWDRVDDIAAAWGWGAPDMYLADSIRQRVIAAIGSFRSIAELHTSVFVPICNRLEGGESGYTTDPNSGPGLQTYLLARAEFRQWIKSGARGQYPEAPPVGTQGPGNAFTPGGEPQTTPQRQLAGFGGIAALGLVALLLGSK